MTRYNWILWNCSSNRDINLNLYLRFRCPGTVRGVGW